MFDTASANIRDQLAIVESNTMTGASTQLSARWDEYMAQLIPTVSDHARQWLTNVILLAMRRYDQLHPKDYAETVHTLLFHLGEIGNIYLT